MDGTTSVTTTQPTTSGDEQVGSPGQDLPSPRRGRGRALLAALLALLLLGGGAGYWYATAGPGASVAVPDVTGESRDEAATVLGEHDLELAEQSAFDESVPEGAAITSSPPTGTELSKGEEVTVVFSKGPERYAVPDLAGMTVTEATAALEEENLTLAGTTQQWHESVAEGAVISTAPGTGTELKRDAQVSVVVSKGPEPIDVPAVTGKSLAAATQLVEAADLEVARGADAHSTTVPKGSVISQSPTGGTLNRGDAVTLTVSKGPEMVTVPKVEGLGKAEATKKLRAAGFTVSVQTFLGGPLDEVRASRPGGGTTAPKGSTVTILVV